MTEPTETTRDVEAVEQLDVAEPQAKTASKTKAGAKAAAKGNGQSPSAKSAGAKRGDVLDIRALKEMTISELTAIAKKLEIEGASSCASRSSSSRSCRRRPRRAG